MRYNSEHKAETRIQVLKLAARAIRLKGADNVAVADLMASAGLTHGGFYSHFPSKDALVEEAIDVMFADARRRSGAFDDALADKAGDVRASLRAFLAGYLAPEHRDRPDRGCPLPALSTDMARNGGGARERFVQGLDRITSRIEAALVRIGVTDPQSEAKAVVAQIVGAISVARAMGDTAQSDAFLRVSFTSLCAKLGL